MGSGYDEAGSGGPWCPGAWRGWSLVKLSGEVPSGFEVVFNVCVPRELGPECPLCLDQARYRSGVEQASNTLG